MQPAARRTGRNPTESSRLRLSHALSRLSLYRPLEKEATLPCPQSSSSSAPIVLLPRPARPLLRGELGLPRGSLRITLAARPCAGGRPTSTRRSFAPRTRSDMDGQRSSRWYRAITTSRNRRSRPRSLRHKAALIVLAAPALGMFLVRARRCRRRSVAQFNRIHPPVQLGHLPQLDTDADAPRRSSKAGAVPVHARPVHAETPVTPPVTSEYGQRFAARSATHHTGSGPAQPDPDQRTRRSGTVLLPDAPVA